MPQPSKPNRPDPKNQKPVTAADQKKCKDWLKAHGHNTAKVNGKKMDTDVDLLQSILDLHGVTPEQLAQAEQ